MLLAPSVRPGCKGIGLACSNQDGDPFWMARCGGHSQSCTRIRGKGYCIECQFGNVSAERRGTGVWSVLNRWSPLRFDH